MGQTRSITINALAPSAVIVQTVCKRVNIHEDASVVGWPTTALLIRIPNPDSPAVEYVAGSSFEFSADGMYFLPGQVVGYVAAVQGSTTLSVIEQ